MLFNSYFFLFVFLPVVFVGFQLCCRWGRTTAASWLIASSLVFYAWWSPPSVVLLAVSVAFNFGAAETIATMESRPRAKALTLAVAIGANLAALAYYKYLTALIGFLSGLGVVHAPTFSIVLPLGISFFTFTQIGYLVDRAQGLARDRGLLDYVLFVTFFPHLIAGPILHNSEMMPQFADQRNYGFSRENVSVGLTMFFFGLAKKCLLADPLFPSVAAGFAPSAHLSAIGAWDTAICASLQIYFDFSGYSDMAIGLARMFNIRFPLNFNSPYKAASIIEHWQRWHMTLSRYLALYLYNPIALAITRRRAARGRGINRAAQATTSGFVTMVALPTMLTMAVAGVWHGAGLQYLIFGLLHGTYLTVNHAWRVFAGPGRPTAKAGAVRHAGNVAVTYLATVIAMLFFRAPSVHAAWRVLAACFGGFGIGHLDWPQSVPVPVGGLFVPVGPLPFASAAVHLLLVAGLLTIVWLAPNTHEVMRGFEPALGRISDGTSRFFWRPGPRWGIATGLLACLAVLGVGGTSEFLYFQF